MSEREYKPFHDKYGRDRGNQWEIMNRDKITIQEAGYITKLIKEYCQFHKYSQVLPLKKWVKHKVMKERREQKTVKWASNVEIFEERFETEKDKQMVFEYRMITKQCQNIQIKKTDETSLLTLDSINSSVINFESTKISISIPIESA